MKSYGFIGAVALFSLLAASPAFAANECPGPNDMAWREYRGGSLTAPTPEERGDVIDLLSQYAHMMDNRDFNGLATLFVDNGNYYHCDPGNPNAVLGISAASLAKQFQTMFANLAATNSSATRQLSSILIGKTTDGNFEVALSVQVSIQTIGVSTVQLDYTAKLYATITKDGQLLKFVVLKVAPDQSGIQASAR
ncbi:hypothetical protein [Rhizobium azibense]|uniref:SnoaL-like protein n=1 Tax=Rhizobium azibense TaxID=1136135 RepID=A0A4R3RP58_9HYPH|nr:hypothetical protein [Rhizobium azibense]TCU35602.1 hypothetical protein EV129_109197 [Rhizobium azibense]